MTTERACLLLVFLAETDTHGIMKEDHLYVIHRYSITDDHTAGR